MEADLRQYCAAKIDPVRIDREAIIPDDVVRDSVRSACLGPVCRNASAAANFRRLRTANCWKSWGDTARALALFVNAHHSIGPRALVLFGTKEQQEKYLPKSATGEWINAFALTEPEAGSDAANVQDYGNAYARRQGVHSNGKKRWITNGGIAQVLTVMARTPRFLAAKRRRSRLSCHARHEGLRGRREANGKMRRPWQRHGEACVPRYVRAEGKYSRATWQGA